MIPLGTLIKGEKSRHIFLSFPATCRRDVLPDQRRALVGQTFHSVLRLSRPEICKNFRLSQILSCVENPPPGFSPPIDKFLENCMPGFQFAHTFP
jgi:hypothetical protein